MLGMGWSNRSVRLLVKLINSVLKPANSYTFQFEAITGSMYVHNMLFLFNYCGFLLLHASVCMSPVPVHPTEWNDENKSLQIQNDKKNEESDIITTGSGTTLCTLTPHIFIVSFAATTPEKTQQMSEWVDGWLMGGWRGVCVPVQ